MFNEQPTCKEQTIATIVLAMGNGSPLPVANFATIHTVLGGMHLQLYPEQAPKAVEHFVGSSYFEGVIFH